MFASPPDLRWRFTVCLNLSIYKYSVLNQSIVVALWLSLLQAFFFSPHLCGLYFVPWDARPASEVRKNSALLPLQTRLHFTPPLLTHNGGWRERERGGGGTRHGRRSLFRPRTSKRKKKDCVVWKKIFQSDVTLLSSLKASMSVDSGETDSTSTCNTFISCQNISV